MKESKEQGKRYCQCGALRPADNPRVILCEACRKRKQEEKYEAHRSPYVQDAARRDARPRAKSQPYKSIEQCVREAKALGISYGQFVARGLDRM